MKPFAPLALALFAATLLASPSFAAPHVQRSVDCDQGSITAVLNQTAALGSVEIIFTGNCTEDLVIDRDHLVLAGGDASATLTGLITIDGASNVVLRDFQVLGDGTRPIRTDLGGVNAVQGAGVTVDGLLVDNVPARGVRVIGSTATIRDTTVLRAPVGAFVFRGSALIFDGTIESSQSLFGMSFVASTGLARNVDFRFNDNGFGLLVQINSALEHVQGSIEVNRNFFGLFLAGQGSAAVGVPIEARDNALVGIILDELSNLTPLIGAPGLGPSIQASGNGTGVSVERDSALELPPGSSITGNGVGISVDNSLLRIAGTTVQGNSGGDVSLGFGTRATFGDDNTFGTSIQCDETVLTRGATGCGASLTSTSTSVDQAGQTALWTEEMAEGLAGPARALVERVLERRGR